MDSDMAVCPSAEQLTKKGKALQCLVDLMEEMELYLFCGDFYFLHPEAIVTKVFFMSGASLLGHLIVNRDYCGVMLPNEIFLKRIIEDENTTIIQPLEIDYDHIEVG